MSRSARAALLRGTLGVVAAALATPPSPAAIGPAPVPAPSVTSVTQPPTVGDEAPTLSGRGQPGAVVSITGGDGTALCSAPVSAAGHWSCTGWAGFGPLRVVATDPAGRTSAPVTVPATDLRVALNLPDAIADTGLATVMVRSNGSGGGARIVVTVSLPAGVVAAGAAIGGLCRGETTLTCALTRPLTVGASVSPPSSWPEPVAPAVGGAASLVLPIRAASRCRPAATGGRGTATVSAAVLDLNRTNNSAADISRVGAGGPGCALSAHLGPGRGLAGVLLGGLGVAVALAAWLWARERG
jgi:Bacterial Ig domain